MLRATPRILLAVELDDDRECLARASLAALETTSALVECLPHREAPRVLVARVGPDEDGRCDAVLADARARLERAGALVALSQPDGEVARTVADLAASWDAGLVVMGKRDATNRRELLLGSTARHVLHWCKRSVWLARPDRPARPRSMLVAVDRDELGRETLELGARLATALSAQLVVVQAFSLSASAQLAGERDVFEVNERRKRSAWVHEVLAAVDGAPQQPALAIALDSPEGLIRRAVAECDPDLCVLGHVGRSGLAGFVFGNTAERLLDEIDTSMLVVRPDRESEAVRV